jgi:hypothetical protein
MTAFSDMGASMPPLQRCPPDICIGERFGVTSERILIDIGKGYGETRVVKDRKRRFNNRPCYSCPDRGQARVIDRRTSTSDGQKKMAI